jgi:uncharacterized protein
MSPEVAVDPRGGPQAPAAAAPAPGPRRSWAAGAMTRAIRGYQLARSGRPTGCRYLPSCSEYAIEALERHGALRGTALAARRLARCTPWGGHGIDPVPDRRTPCTHP